MANLLNCVFCHKSDESLIFFTEDTLKKCQNILILRKEHSLKLKDVLLPVELFESGYHRQCYKSFTGLMKKYQSKSTTTKPNLKDSSSSATGNQCTASSSICNIESTLIKINFMECHFFIVINNRVVSSIDENLSCPQHEEADTKIIHHVCNIDTQKNIAIPCSDTDVSIIMLGHMHRLKDVNSHVCVLTGTGNNQRYVDLTKINGHLGPFVCRSLIGFHAITGCDYNPAFLKKGKQKPFKILQRCLEYQQAFIKFGELELFSDKDKEQDVFDTIQKFICELYNVSGIVDVDAARSTIWNNAHEKHSSTLSPENNGWILKDSQYDFNWFDGDQLPSFVSDSLRNELEEPNDDEDELNIQFECEFDEGSRKSCNEDNEDE